MSQRIQANNNTQLGIMLGSLLFAYWLVLPVILGAYSDLYGLQENQLGMLASGYSFGIFIATLLSTVWITRYPRRTQVIIGALITSFGFLLLKGHANGDYLTLAYHFIASLGLGVAYAALMAVLADSENPTRSYALLFFTQVMIGVSGSILLTRFIETEELLPITYLAMLLVGVFCATLATQLKDTSDPNHLSQTAPAIQRWFPPMPVALGLLSILLVFTGDAGVWVFLERIGAAAEDRELGGDLVSVNLAAGAIGSLAAAWLANRFGYLWPMIAAIALSIASVVMLNLSINKTVLVCASFINGWAWNFGAAYRMALVSQLDKERRFVALIPAMQTLGNAVGPTLVGTVIVWSSYSMAYWVVSILWLGAMMSYYPAWRAYRELQQN